MPEAEPITITPAMIQPRGAFPVHSDRVEPLLTGEQARALAFWRLKLWRAARRGEGAGDAE